MVQTYLEYCTQFWLSYLKKDTAELEKVPEMATVMIKGLESLSYEERLKSQLGITVKSSGL